MRYAHDDKCGLDSCLDELVDGRKPEVVPRGNDGVLDWRESANRVESANPFHVFEIFRDPSTIAGFEYCLEGFRIVELNSLRYPKRRYSRRLRARRTERLSQDI